MWSVAWTAPPVRRAMSQLSTVPTANSPASARQPKLGVFSKEPGELGAGKIGIQEKAGVLLEPPPPAPVPSAPRRWRWSAGPARRWPGEPAPGSPGPRGPRFPAGW